MGRVYTLDGATPSGPAIDFASELNEQQLAAATHLGSPSLIIAGAGSGKTRTLTYRVAWLLSQGVPPSAILLLTFTNKAAREMLDRVANLMPQASAGIWGGTFHSIGNRILRANAHLIGYQRGFTIMDSEDAEDLIHAVVQNEGFTDKKFPKPAVLSDIFGLSVNTGKSIYDTLAGKYPYFIYLTEEIERVHVAYEHRKREGNVMDFDDLLTKTLQLFHEHPDVLAHYQQRFEHVLVDEYQDTTRIQAELAAMLAARSGNLTVVGDDAQSIYSWRGAHFANILDFPKRHPDAKVFKIETNYRSVPQVLDVANAAIQANERQFAKTLQPVRPQQEQKPILAPVSTNNAQASFVAQRIQELIASGIAPEEIAVLYRAHFHSMEVQLELTRRAIPFTITSGLRFFEQAHIKDVAAFLKFAVNPRDEIAFKRAVRLLPAIGEKSADQMWRNGAGAFAEERNFAALHALKVPAKAQKPWKQFVHTIEELMTAPAAREISSDSSDSTLINSNPTIPTPPRAAGAIAPSQMISIVMEALYEEIMQQKFSNYEARKEDIATLAGYARQFENCEDFLTQLSLLVGIEAQEALTQNRADQVTLSTIHQAKGLEWKVVFLIYLNDGLFPHARSSEAPETLEEERRLFYVGITRGKDELYLTFPLLRLNTQTGDSYQPPSRFLSEIPPALLDTWKISG